MDHCDIVSIMDYMIESTNKFAECRLEEHIKVTFQYLQHFQDSAYNFMNVNSINDDVDNCIYTFMINKQYFQFPMYDINTMVICARSLLTTLRNAKEYLMDIENRKNNYCFEYVQELIKDGFNNILKKYVNLHKFLKIIEKKPITLTDAILFFNNAVVVFNEKFEILKMFPCIDNVLYIYYYDVNKDFSKLLITKIFIPQLQITSDVKLKLSEEPRTMQSTIFSPAYNSFFTDSGNCYNNGSLPRSNGSLSVSNVPNIPTNSCSPMNNCPPVGTNHCNLTSNQTSYFIHDHLCHDYTCTGHGSHPCHSHTCHLSSHHSSSHYHLCHDYTCHLHGKHACHSHVCGIITNNTCSTSHTCNTSTVACNSHVHLCHDQTCHLCNHHPCHAPSCCSTNVAYNHSHIIPTNTQSTLNCNQPSGITQPCKTNTISTTCTTYTDSYCYEPGNCASTLVYDPKTCSHSHIYNPVTNLHTHVYTTSTCVHTLVYDPSSCTITHSYDPNACCHKYVYDPCHCYSESCDSSVAFDLSNVHIYDISSSSHTIVHDASGCVYTSDTSGCVHIHTYDSSGCLYTMTYDDYKVNHKVVFNPNLCEHTIINDSSGCKHIYETLACTHTIVLDISNHVNEYLIDMSGCIFNHTYDSSGCKATIKYNDFYVDYNGDIIVDNIFTRIYDSSTVKLTSVFDPSYCAFTESVLHEFEDTVIIDSSDVHLTSIYDPSLCTFTSTYTIDYKDTLTVDASDVHLTSIFDPSACEHISIINTDYENIYTIDASDIKLVTTYDPSYCIHTIEKNYKHTFTRVHDSSSVELTSIFDPSLCTFTQLDISKNIYTTTVDASDVVLTSIYDLSDNIYDSISLYDFTQVTTIDASDVHLTSIFDPSACEHSTTVKTYFTNIDTFDSSHCILEAKYNTETCTRSFNRDDCTCTTIYTYDISGYKHDISYNIINCTHKIVYDVSDCSYEFGDEGGKHMAKYTTGTDEFKILYDPMNTTYTHSYEISSNEYTHIYNTIHGTHTCFLATEHNKTINIVDVSGVKCTSIFDVSDCNIELLYDMSCNIDISGDIYTFDVSNCKHIIDASSCDISYGTGFYIFDISNVCTTLNHGITHFVTNIETHDADGLDCVVTHDISKSKFHITYDPSLCSVDISGDIYTFDISDCKHIIDASSCDISYGTNFYTFDISSSSTVDISYISHDISLTTFDISGLYCSITTDILENHYNITYDPSLCSVDISGDIYTFDVSDCKHIIDASNCVIDIGDSRYYFESEFPMVISSTDISFCTNIESYHISGLECTVTYDISKSKFHITYDNSLCVPVISGDVYTFDISNCKHIIDASNCDISNGTNFYTFDISGTDVSVNLVHSSFRTDIHNFDISGLECTVTYDISKSKFHITYDPSLCSVDISNHVHTFHVNDDVNRCKHIIDASFCDISNGTNFYTFDISGTDTSYNITNYYRLWNTVIHDISGLYHYMKYDVSNCKHTITYDPSLCSMNVSGNVHTFDVSNCKHTIVCDISSNIGYTYTYDSSYNTDLSSADISFNTYIDNIDMSGCKHVITYNHLKREHVITYNTDVIDFGIHTDSSGNIVLKYDVSDTLHTITYDPTKSSFTSESDDCDNYVHTVTVYNDTERTIDEPIKCSHTHEFDVSDCPFTRLHLGPGTEIDTSSCTHKHIFDPCDNIINLIYDASDTLMYTVHDTSECTSTYRYVNSVTSCEHILIYDTIKHTFKHYYNDVDCSHQHVYDIVNLADKYVFDRSYAIVYDASSCTHKSHVWIEKHRIRFPYAHYFPYSHHYIVPKSHVITNIYTPFIYGYRYMYGTMIYIHKHLINNVVTTHSHVATDPHTQYVYDPTHAKAHGFVDTTNAACITAGQHHALESCLPQHSQFEYYSKMFNPIYDSHLQTKGIDYYSDSTWNNFVKVKFGLFDADNICVINQCEFVVYLGNDYVRFSEYDITTDIFYSRLTAFNCKLYSILNVDYKDYQITKEFICDNIFNQKKLLQFKCIYQEYLSQLELLQLDIENIQGLSSNNENIGAAVNSTNEGMMRNICARFSKLYNDLERNVLMNSDGTSFDIRYLDYSQTPTYFARNNNLTVTQFVVDEKIIKVVLTLDSAYIVLERFTDTYTHEMLRTLCKNNLLNIALFIVIMETNLKHIDDLLIKQYS